MKLANKLDAEEYRQAKVDYGFLSSGNRNGCEGLYPSKRSRDALNLSSIRSRSETNRAKCQARGTGQEKIVRAYCRSLQC